MTEPIDVAVGVLVRDDGSFLLAQRPDGKPMAGYWEFPGGKLEVGETVFDALVREFDEELGLRIVGAQPWVQRVVVYPHATVRLHFWRSFGDGRGWHGTPQSREGQSFRWESIDALTTAPWLEGALPVKRWLRLPATYAISNAWQAGVDHFVAALDRRLADGTVRQLQLREPAMDDGTFATLFDAVNARCSAHGVRLVVNSAHPRHYWSMADGVHLSSRELMRLERRPHVGWCFASCHDAADLARAGVLGLDAVVLGPVGPTASHPDAHVLGWSGFAAIAASTSLPVYALGGLTADDLTAARQAGAHGVAMIRAAWS
ncbi:MAG: Nudix family hydrolase [Burkholderiaceae bacterium]